MIYCDTSLLVAGITSEARSDEVRGWLRQRASGELCVSGWTVTEFSSAIAMKVRQGSVPADRQAAVLTGWRSMLGDALGLVPVSPEAFELAARFADRHELGLRAPDALHIAVAWLGGHSLATLDVRMAAGAATLGVETVSV